MQVSMVTQKERDTLYVEQPGEQEKAAG